MHTSETVSNEPLAKSVEVGDSMLTVSLDDGRLVSVPLDWYPRLKEGTPEERAQYELLGKGTGIHWPLLDEDISVEGLLAGRRSGESEGSLEHWRRERG